MDKRTISAIVISILIMVAWQKFYMDPYQEKLKAWEDSQKALQEQSAQQDSTANSSGAKIGKSNSKTNIFTGVKGKTNSAASNLPVEKSSVVDNETIKLTVSNGASFLANWDLKKYHDNKSVRENESAEPVQMSLAHITGFSNQLKLRFMEDSIFGELNNKNWTLEKNQNGNVAYSINTPEVKITRELRDAGQAYAYDLNYSLSFSDKVPAYVFIDLFGRKKRDHDTDGSFFGEQPDKVKVSYRDFKESDYYIADTVTERFESTSPVSWFGVDTRYFLLGLVPDDTIKPNTGIQISPENVSGHPAVRGSLVVATKGAKNINIPLKLYFGPKEIAYLDVAHPVLNDSLDFGWTTPIALFLLKALKWLYSFLGNYGIAIIILTFFVKVALFPLTYKSMKSMAKMSKLQPQLTKLREKYKDDKERLNREMMTFMKSNGYNPMGGCLPILLQMPIFFALYRVLFNSIELFQAPFFWWIQDLSIRDPWFVTPILLTGLMYFQQKITPNPNMDPAQAKVMQMMPLMFGFFMIMLPAGLNIYMLVNSAISIAQQYVLNKKFGIGQFAPKASDAESSVKEPVVVS